MQGIAYIIDGSPRLTWPAQTETDILDAEGYPTGETEITDNLQGLIAALPKGTKYELLTEEEAEAWLIANRSPAQKEQAFYAVVMEKLNQWAVDRGWDSIDRVLAQTGTFAADAQVAQQGYDLYWVKAFEILPQLSSGKLTFEQAVAKLPNLPAWPN
ncbi:MAG: hypothetical protein FWG97_01195 [Deltaproteobacteria bacterium]|nr:hypothetical protein [Deltaproteobacteria bacterium]